MARLDQIIGAPVAASEYVAPKEYALSEQFGAAFEDFNSLSAIRGMFADDMNKIYGMQNPVDFDPFDGTHDIRQGYEDLYTDIYRPEDISRINQKIDNELANEEIIAGSNLAIAMAAGIIDPINLVPLSILGKGKTALSTAARFAGTTALTETAIESAFQSTQETRTLKESIMNVGIASIMTGAFGGALSAMSKIDPAFDPKAFIKAAEEDFALSGSAGAAKVGDEVTLADLGPADAFGLEKIIAFQDPVSRMASMPSKIARDVVGRMAEIPFIRKGSQGEVAAKVPVENWVRQWDYNKGQFVKFLDDSYVQYRKSDPTAKGGAFKQLAMDVSDVVSRPKNILTRRQFNEEVSRSLRRGDKHEIPEVAAAASHFRNNVIKPLAEEAMKVKKKDGTGLLPDDIDLTSASNYLMRLWDRNKIMNNSRAFDDMNIAYLKQQRDAAAERVAEWEDLHLKANQILKDTKKEVRMAIRDKKADISAAQKKLITVSRDERNAKAMTRKAETAYRRILKRMDEFRPDELSANDKSYYRDLFNDIRRGSTAEKPKSLTTFVRSAGGILDDDGWLAAQDMAKGTTGIINNSSGKTMDDMALAAMEAGYYAERPSIDDFMQDLVGDFRGEILVTKSGDEDLIIRQMYIDEAIEQFDRLGYNINNIKDPAHLKKLIDDLPDTNTFYRESTPAARAKYREIVYQAKIARERLDEMDALTIKLEKDVIDAAELVRNSKAAGSSLAARLKDARKDIRSQEKSVAKIAENLERDRFYGSFLDSDIAQVATELRNRIVSGPAGRMEYSYKIDKSAGNSLSSNKLIGSRGPLKGRTYNIDDLFEHNGIKVEDFLTNDIEDIANAYVRSMSSQVGLVKEFGSLDLEDEIRRMEGEFEILSNRAKDQKTATKIQKAGKQAQKDLKALRDRLLGTYETADDWAGTWARSIRSIKALNYMLYLGGMTVSALPDIGRPVMVHGINRVYKDAIAPLVNNRQAIQKVLKEFPEAGIAWEMVLNTRAAALGGMDEFVDTSGKVEAWLSKQSGRFSALSLMPMWNDALKQFSGITAQARMLESIEAWKLGKIKKADKTFLQDNYISEDLAKRIQAQFERHGENDRGVRIANAANWDDIEARDVWRAALRRTVNNTIVTPGLDKPLMMSVKGPMGPFGPLIFQFKSFALASMQRTLMTGLQQRDMAVLNGAALMTGLGMLVYAAKTTQNGNELSDNPAKWVLEGVDRSGLGAWVMTANALTEKMTRGAFGLNALAGQEPMSRYASQNLGSALAGPTMGTLTNLAQTTGAIASGEWTQSDVRAMRQLMMYQNHFAFRYLFDEAENNLNEAFGIPTRK